MTWRPFLVALALPLVFTTLVFVDVQRNRQSARQPIALTGGDVTINAGTEQNSGATAWLTWAADQPPGERWLSREQLAAIGFDVSIDPASADAAGAYARQLQRRAYVVLSLRADQRSRSSLAPIDAGPDRDRLLAKYPNGSTHIVTAGIVEIRRNVFPGGLPYEDGFLANIDPRGIHIPSKFNDRLARDPQRGRSLTLLVRYGAQLEPWVVDVK
jgi:hypothetical protein